MGETIDVKKLAGELEQIFEQSALLLGHTMLAGVRRRDPAQYQSVKRAIDSGARLVVSFVNGKRQQIEASVRDDAGTMLLIGSKDIQPRTKQ